MIKIGIIDSGLNCAAAGIAEAAVVGKKFWRNAKGDIMHKNDAYADEMGHGTRCAGIIAEAVPNAQYHVAKIFQHSLATDVEVLVAAIYWCIEQAVDIINISLGIRSKTIHPALQAACDRAFDQGIVMVAAANNDNQVCFPAYYHKVLGVGHAVPSNGAAYLWVPHSAVECYTVPPATHLPLEASSTSFCCPVITSLAAQLMEANGLRGLVAVRHSLATQASAEQKYYLPLHKPHGYTDPSDFNHHQLARIAQRHLAACGMLKPLGRIRLAPMNDLAFSFMEGLVPIINYPPLCTGNFGLSPKGQLDAAFTDPAIADSFDTVALGQLAYCLDGSNEALFTAGLERLLKNKKRFLVFDNQSAHIIRCKARQLGIKAMVHQQVFNQRLYRDFRQFRFLPDQPAPILAVVGTGYNEVVSLQLYLKEFFTTQGIPTACISPALQGNLMGADFALPLVFNESNTLTALQLYNMVPDVLKAVQFFCQPQLIVTGTVNGVLPPFDADGFGWSDNVAWLQSLKPSAVLCVIEDGADAEEVHKTLACLYAHTNCPVLLQASQRAMLQVFEPFAAALFAQLHSLTLNSVVDWEQLLSWVKNNVMEPATKNNYEVERF